MFILRSLKIQPPPSDPAQRALERQARFILERAPLSGLDEALEAVARLVMLEPLPDGERADPPARVAVNLSDGNEQRTAEWRAKDFVYDNEPHKPFGNVDVIYESGRFGLYRLNIAPGSQIPWHMHQVMEEWELVITDGLVATNMAVAAGTELKFPRGTAHHYLNPTGQWQAVLCIDTPPFIPDDEIEVPAP